MSRLGTSQHVLWHVSLLHPAADAVPIGCFFREAGIGNSEPLLQVFSLVDGNGAEIQGSDAGTVESHWERLVGTGKDVAGGSARELSKCVQFARIIQRTDRSF